MNPTYEKDDGYFYKFDTWAEKCHGCDQENFDREWQDMARELVCVGHAVSEQTETEAKIPWDGTGDGGLGRTFV